MPNTQVALVMKTQARLTGASSLNRFVGMNTTTSRERARDAARRFRCDRVRRPNLGLGISDRWRHCKEYHQRQRGNPKPTECLRDRIHSLAPGLPRLRY